MIRISEVKLERLEPHMGEATRHSILFPKGATYFLAEESHDLISWTEVGFASIHMRKHSAELKSAYVLPRFRKKGIYRKLLDHRLKYAKDKRLNGVTAVCTPDSYPIWTKMGARLQKEYKNGLKLVLLILQ